MSPGSGRRGTLSEINVTPLVDVMLVLLIMFMVTVPMMQQGIEVKLPETKSGGVEVNDEPLVLTVTEQGELLVGEAKVSMQGLGKKLNAIVENRKNKQIYVRADRSVDYGRVAEAIGEIRSAGIFNIGLVTLPKSR